MKRRCTCGKPDTMEYGIWQDIEFDNLLHFKSADRECERCGRPLCKDCQVLSTYMLEDWELMFPAATCLCPICAREVV